MKHDKNKHFKIKECIKDRNQIRYILSNPFEGKPLSNTILEFLKEQKVFIINKKESCDKHITDLSYQIKLKEHIFFININISKDHLITIKIASKTFSTDIKTRVPSIVISTLKEALNSLGEKC